MISSRQRKYALVTGASSGIGREYAAQLAAKGYDLVMAGNRDEENRAAAREIAARYGVRTLPLCMDLSEPDAAVKLHAETSARGIEIGVLVCNAGVLLFGPLAAAPPERIGRIVTLHCTTPALLCRLYGEEMRRRVYPRDVVSDGVDALSDDCGLRRDEKFPAHLRPVAEFRVPQIRRPRDGCFPGGGRYAAVRSGRRLPPPAASLGRHVCAAGGGATWPPGLVPGP